MKSVKGKYKEIFANGMLIHKFHKNLDLAHKTLYSYGISMSDLYSINIVMYVFQRMAATYNIVCN